MPEATASQQPKPHNAVRTGCIREKDMSHLTEGFEIRVPGKIVLAPLIA